MHRSNSFRKRSLSIFAFNSVNGVEGIESSLLQSLSQGRGIIVSNEGFSLSNVSIVPASLGITSSTHTRISHLHSSVNES